MAIEQIVDHANRALDRVITQFRESAFFKGLLTALSAEAQEVEDALWGLMQAYRTVSVATGTTLDNIGKLVGAPARGTKTDTQYRNRINAQIIANLGSGDFDSIYEISKLIVSAWAVSGQPKITEHLGAYEIAANPRGTIINSDAEARELAILLNDISAAGVRGIVISQQVDEDDAFAFDGGTGLGFGAGDFTGAYDK